MHEPSAVRRQLLVFAEDLVFFAAMVTVIATGAAKAGSEARQHSHNSNEAQREMGPKVAR